MEPNHPTSALWAQHRDQICALYKQMPLRIVIETMEKEHSFKATPRMYKARFAIWGLSKYSKRRKTWTPVMPVGGDECGDYGILSSQASAEGTAHGTLVQRSPNNCTQDGRTGNMVLMAPQFTTAADLHLQYASGAGGGPSAPRGILCIRHRRCVLERAVFFAQECTSNLYRVKRWAVGPEAVFRMWQEATVLSISLYDGISKACALFSQGTLESNRRAAYHLELATGAIKDLACFECRFLELPRVLLILCCREKRSEIARMILRSFSDFRELFHGRHDPVNLFCRLLMDVDDQTLIEALERASIASHHTFITHICFLHRSAMQAAVEGRIHATQSQSVDQFQDGLCTEVPKFKEEEWAAIITRVFSCEQRGDSAGRSTHVRQLCDELNKPDYYRIVIRRREDGNGKQSAVAAFKVAEALRLKKMANSISTWYEIWEPGDHVTLGRIAQGLHQVVQDIPVLPVKARNDMVDTNPKSERTSMIEAMQRLALAPDSWKSWTQNK